MSTIQAFINNNFGGIRRKDATFAPEKISCSDCQNVELYFTKLNSGIGIRTAKGNSSVSSYMSGDELVELIPEGEDVIGIFESIQDGDTYFIVYTEGTEGKIYSLNILNHELTEIITGLSVTGNACGTDFKQGWFDYFVFSNGVDIKYIYSDTVSHTHLIVDEDSFTNEKLYTISGTTVTEVASDASADKGILTATLSGTSVTLNRKTDSDTTVNSTSYYAWSDGMGNYYYTTVNENVILIDQESRNVIGLGLVVYDSRLWIFNEKVLWYSKQGECRDFAYNVLDIITSAGYIEFVKNITAIYPYLGSLAVFYKESSALVKTDQSLIFTVTEESPGGCASYDSLVFHGTDLYFYDNTKKGVFSFQQIVNGDKTLGNNIAYDIQDELLNINERNVNKIRALSVVTSDRNEVWFLIPISNDVTHSIIMIFDYIRGEWVKRKCQKINAIGIVDGILYSAGESVYQEYMTDNFNGEFIESYYNCTIMNLGTDNSLKITKMPPRLALDSGYSNNFNVRYIKNYNKLKSNKVKEIKSKSVQNILIYDSGMKYDANNIYKPNNVTLIAKLPSATFKALEIQFFTDKIYQSFCIMSMEITKLKVKQV